MNQVLSDVGEWAAATGGGYDAVQKLFDVLQNGIGSDGTWIRSSDFINALSGAANGVINSIQPWVDTLDRPGLSTAASNAGASAALIQIGANTRQLASAIVSGDGNRIISSGLSLVAGYSGLVAAIDGKLVQRAAYAARIFPAAIPITLVATAASMLWDRRESIKWAAHELYDWLSTPNRATRFNDANIASARRLYQQSQWSSPSILDTNGDGVVATRSLAAGVYFDHDGNQLAERSGWVGAGDALLVRDLNGNGQIDNGGELFGNHTRTGAGTQTFANGFDTLRSLGGNADGFVDAQDAAWASLRLWHDDDADAVVDAGELPQPAFMRLTGRKCARRRMDTTDELLERRLVKQRCSDVATSFNTSWEVRGMQPTTWSEPWLREPSK